MLKKIRACILIAPILLTMSNATAALTDPLRTGFISETQKACLKTQRAGAPNAQVADKVLQQYCLCSGIYMADMLNNALAKEIYDGNQKLNPSLIDLAATYCQKNYGKY